MGAHATDLQFKMIREHDSILAASEKRLLVRMAGALPAWVNSDHLTFTGSVAMLGIGVSFWAGGWALLMVIPLLAVNWFGDSLDGTLARVRRCERPRYGYYVDHVLDAAGFAALVGGLILGGHLSPPAGLCFLSAYFLVVIEVALATHARGTFRLSAWGMGPTELRMLLAAGTLQLMRSEAVVLFGHRWLLFDVGALCGVAALVATFVRAAIVNGVALYREERLP